MGGFFGGNNFKGMILYLLNDRRAQSNGGGPNQRTIRKHLSPQEVQLQLDRLHPGRLLSSGLSGRTFTMLC